MNIKKCKECNGSMEGKRKSQKFCSRSCGVIYNNKIRTFSEETRKKISHAVGKATKGKKRKIIKSILELSSRTVRKILKRLNLGCSQCGWDLGVCDIHHINGRKIDDADNHENLSLVCPNCHRLIHEGIIKKETLIDLTHTIPSNWRTYYYG